MKTPPYVYLIGNTKKVPTYVKQIVKDLRNKFGKSDILIERLSHGQYVVKHELTGEKQVVYC